MPGPLMLGVFQGRSGLVEGLEWDNTNGFSDLLGLCLGRSLLFSHSGHSAVTFNSTGSNSMIRVVECSIAGHSTHDTP